MNTSKIEVSHPCDECGVWTSFTLGKADDTIQHADSIEYYKKLTCSECGTLNYHAGVYELEWAQSN